MEAIMYRQKCNILVTPKLNNTFINMSEYLFNYSEKKQLSEISVQIKNFSNQTITTYSLNVFNKEF
jgi:hypothetical protein